MKWKKEKPNNFNKQKWRKEKKEEEKSNLYSREKDNGIDDEKQINKENTSNDRQEIIEYSQLEYL